MEMMVKDAAAYGRWLEKYHEHTDAVCRELFGHPELCKLLPDQLWQVTIQVYHEGIEGLRKRGL